ncbi:MAG TPA: hypothetical protein PKY59_00375 [Pyrinomonadaceae bacterium]|nr:hypothetical protein [Pyrinomonadaceae bacterium]
MNQFTAQQKIELLDRKYSFLMNSSTETFLFDLVGFIKFIREDEIIKDFTDKIRQDFELAKRNHRQNLSQWFSKVKRIMKKHQVQFLNESDYWLNDYISSSNHFINGFLNPSSPKTRLETILRDEIQAEHIVFRLQTRCENENWDKKTKDNIGDLIKENKFYFSEWKLVCKTSTGRSLEDLEYIVLLLFGKPKYSKEVNAMKPNTRFSHWYEESENEENYRPYLTNPNIFLLIKGKVTRVYESLRQEIGSTRLRTTILNRYAIRCENYNRNYVIKLGEEADSRKLEETLTSDLALYLFDNGITVWYRVKTEKKETDLIEINPASSNPMLIEVKAYHAKSKKSKSNVIEDFWQTISYLVSHRKNNPSYEGYLVFYRLGGSLFVLPEKFTYQNFTIYPILIDLADNVGRNQKNGITISIEDILKETPSKI